MAVKSIGAALRRIRVRESLSLSAVAKKAGMSDAMLSRIERGERRNPQFNTIARVAFVLGVSLDELASEAGLPVAVYRRTPSTASADLRREEHLKTATRYLERAQNSIERAQEG